MEEQNNKARTALARSMARKLLNDARIEHPPVLINDVVNHIKKIRKLSVYPWSFSNKTSGIQVTDKDSSFIGYNEKHSIHRQRFTVAHEIGHLLLGHTSDSFILDFYSRNPEEIEANQFAAELLMPLPMLKEDLSGGKKDVKFIAERYNVSEEAVWWRLLDMKLIKKI
jgi:Zn-dependent peptidase ImmA (M78 family)